MREAAIANGIKHRAIVPVRDDGMTEEGCAYLVLELLEGETLDEKRVRAGGKLSLEELAPIIEELGSCLAAVHGAGVVHRDVKPQNVFLTKDGGLKLLDFGTARAFEQDTKSKLSVQGLVIGTPSFMAPEQALGKRDEIDARTDVWAFGATLFTCLTGEFVHVARDAHARLLAAGTKKARSIGEVLPDLEERAVTILDRALQFKQADRWPDARSMRVAFRHALVASMPTLRALPAFDEVIPDEERDPDSEVMVAGTTIVDVELLPKNAKSDPPLVATRESMATPLPTSSPLSGVETGAGVAATQGRRAHTRGTPFALFAAGAMGLAVVAAVGLYAAREEPKTPTAAGLERDRLEPVTPHPVVTPIDLANQKASVTIEAVEPPPRPREATIPAESPRPKPREDAGTPAEPPPEGARATPETTAVPPAEKGAEETTPTPPLDNTLP